MLLSSFRYQKNHSQICCNILWALEELPKTFTYPTIYLVKMQVYFRIFCFFVYLTENKICIRQNMCRKN